MSTSARYYVIVFMKRDTKPEEKRRAEAAANGYAYKWGFADDLQILHRCEPTDYVPE